MEYAILHPTHDRAWSWMMLLESLKGRNDLTSTLTSHLLTTTEGANAGAIVNVKRCDSGRPRQASIRQEGPCASSGWRTIARSRPRPDLHHDCQSYVSSAIGGRSGCESSRMYDGTRGDAPQWRRRSSTTFAFDASSIPGVANRALSPRQRNLVDSGAHRNQTARPIYIPPLPSGLNRAQYRSTPERIHPCLGLT